MPIDYWQEKCKLLEQHLQGDCSNFLSNWHFLRETMFHEVDSRALNDLKMGGYWPVWEKGLNEDNFGNSPRYRSYPQSSGNLIHHAFSLSQLYPSGDIKHLKSIFEFGGGYGSFCRLLYRLGFEGNYIGYDFPIYIKLQKLYLEKVGIFSDKINLISQLEQNIDVDLFVALWSLSESPETLKDEILKKVSFKEALITFSKEGHGPNLEYFTKVMNEMQGYVWKMYATPYIKGSYYLIGRKNG